MKKDKTFSRLLREYFVFYGIIPAFAISILLLTFVFFFQQYTIKQDIRMSNQQSAEALEAELKRQEYFLTSLAESEDIRRYLLQGYDPSSVYEQFYRFNRSTKLQSVINILDADGILLSSSSKLSDTYSAIKIRMIADRIGKNLSAVLNEANLLEYPSGDRSVYTLGTVIMADDKVVGYVLMQTLEESIRNVMKSDNMLHQIATDKFDRIIGVENESDYQPGDRFDPAARTDRNQAFQWQTHLTDFDITLYTSGTISPVRRSFGNTIIISLVIVIHLMILVNMISKKLSRRVTEPIQNLVQAFSYLKTGETEYITDHSSIEEFRFLAEEYNHMLCQLNQLMKRNAELSELRRIAQIKQLEAQFAPHFFLNMLETLRYMSLLSHEEAEKMIVSLSGILQYSLYSKGQFSLIEDDTRYVEDYLYLQKTRIGSNFSYNLVLDDSAKGFVVPKLLIQPLIENSVKHGYQGVAGFHIDIYLYREGDDLISRIADNGRGISNEKAADLLKMLREEGQTEHIGLANVHKRLEYMYGEGYGVQAIDGSQGFCVTVRMKGERKAG